MLLNCHTATLVIVLLNHCPMLFGQAEDANDCVYSTQRTSIPMPLEWKVLISMEEASKKYPNSEHLIDYVQLAPKAATAPFAVTMAMDFDLVGTQSAARRLKSKFVLEPSLLLRNCMPKWSTWKEWSESESDVSFADWDGTTQKDGDRLRLFAGSQTVVTTLENETIELERVRLGAAKDQKIVINIVIRRSRSHKALEENFFRGEQPTKVEKTLPLPRSVFNPVFGDKWTLPPGATTADLEAAIRMGPGSDRPHK